MTMPIDLVVCEVNRKWPKSHCPNEYVKWLCGSFRDAYAIAKVNLKKLPNGRGKVMSTPIALCALFVDVSKSFLTLSMFTQWGVPISLMYDVLTLQSRGT